MSNSNCSVARWLETFFCEKYADLFENHGYKTLNQVCSLDTEILYSMGVTPNDCEKIMDNVFMLKQVLQLASSSYYPSIDPLDTITSSIKEKPHVIDTKIVKKPKLKIENKTTSIAPPNVTLKPNKTNQISQHLYVTEANPELAKKIANKFLLMSKIENSNSKYTFLSLNKTLNRSPQFMVKNNENLNLQSEENLFNDPIKSTDTQCFKATNIVENNFQHQQLLKENTTRKRVKNPIDSQIIDDSHNPNKKLYQENLAYKNQDYYLNESQIQNSYYSNANIYQQEWNNNSFYKDNNFSSLNFNQNYGYSGESMAVIPPQIEQQVESVYNNTSYQSQQQNYYQYSQQYQFYVNTQ